jgi:hypothetical protein
MRRAVLSLALLAVSVSLSGCGVAGTIDPVASAASKSQDAGSAKVTMAVDVGVGAKSYSLTGGGAFSRDSGEMTIDASGVADLAGLPGDAKIRVVYRTEDGDKVVYVQLPGLEKQIPGGKSWIRLDLQKAAQAAGFDLGDALGSATQNPGDALAMLRAGGPLTEVGTETLDGTSTTHYKGTIDLAAAAKLKGVSEETLRRLNPKGEKAEIPVDVWIGDDGLVRQVRITESDTAGSKTVSSSVTFGFTDYGTDVSVAAPAADDVFDATALAGMLGQTKTK